GRTVRMEELGRHFELWGGRNVETFIASGNVIFETARKNAQATERAIEEHIWKALGYPVITFLRSLPELALIAAHTPFPDSEYVSGGRLFVGFMKSSADRSVIRAIESLQTDVDDFAVDGRELYWLRRAQLMASLASEP